MTATTGQSKLGMVLRVTSGNFLEMFDFFLSGVYASYIAKAFFPLENEYASLLLTFVAFGAGFLMRPLGAIILGAYVDRIGRRKGLIVTLSIMACRHSSHRIRAKLRDHWNSRADSGIDRPPAARIFSRRRAGWRFGLPCGNGDARKKGLLRELAIGKPASRHHRLGRAGLCLECMAFTGAGR